MRFCSEIEQPFAANTKSFTTEDWCSEVLGLGEGPSFGVTWNAGGTVSVRSK